MGFTTLLGNLHVSRDDMDHQNAMVIASQETIDMANARITENQAALDIVNAEIAHQEDLRDTDAEDRDVAQADLDEETERWAGVQASYDAYVDELMHELDALDRCIGVFASFDMSDEMLDRVDW